MNVSTVQGVVIKRRNIGEADRILTVFTKERGKIRVLAKGIRRVPSRRASHLEIFSHVKLTVHAGKKWDIVTEAVRLEHPGDQTLAKISMAYYLCELVDKLTPIEETNPHLFELLLSQLSALWSIGEDDLFTFINMFALELLWLLGYLPRERQMTLSSVNTYIESITERRIGSVNLIQSIYGDH